MTDYGSMAVASEYVSPTYDAEPFSNYVADLIQVNVYPSRPALDYTSSSYDSSPTGNYRIAGTIDSAYHPPLIGQLWPRGDLDALDPLPYDY